MKKNNLLIFVFALSLLFAGCIKDKGTYSYKDPATYFVDTTGLPKIIVVKQNDVFQLNITNAPGVVTSGLTYRWRLVDAGFTANPATGKFYDVQISTEKNLNYKITELPAEYVLVLYVTDNNSGGLTQIIKFPFIVSSFASPGWMVLHGDATKGSDISIVVNNRLNSLLPPNTDYIQENVFSETNGIKIEGEGAAVFYMSNHWVDIFTNNNKGGHRVSGNDLRTINSYSDMFVSPLGQPDVQFQGYAGWSYNELMVNKGDLFFTSQANANIYNKFGVKCFGEDYIASPFIASQFNFSYYGAIYDIKNKRFLYIDFNRGIKTFKAPGAAAAFDMSNTGKEMVYAEHGFNKYWYCVMQNDADPASRELFVSNLNVTDDGNRGVARYNISAATDLNKASSFAFGHRGNVMYYATGTKVYQNNYSGDKASALRYDVTANYPGYAITQMRLLKVNNHAEDGKILYIALYNNGTKEGKLLQITVNEVSGLFGAVKEYSGFGKITGMNYKAK